MVPKGDPFTYTVGFFGLLDRAHNDYFGTLRFIFGTYNWYWLQNFLLTLFSPIIIKEPYSMSLGNFVLFGAATASFFRLARNLNFNLGISIFLAFIWWIYPSNYGYLTYQSIPVLALDAAFLCALAIATANMLVYAIDFTSVRNAIIAGLVAGLAIWGRGNSAPYLAMIIFIPFVFIVYQVWKLKAWKTYNRTLLGFILFCSILLFMSALFYARNWGALGDYYIHHATFVTRQVWNINDAMPYIKNIPGYFFIPVENLRSTISLSWVLHLLVITSLYIATKRNRSLTNHRSSIKLIALTGGLIYFATYFVNLVLFTDPLMNLVNALLIWAPMLVGLTLSIFALLASFILSTKMKLSRWVFVPVIILFVLYSWYQTDQRTPLVAPFPNAASPSEIEAFSLQLDKMLGDNGTLSLLYYEGYNHNILNYYRLKNGLPAFKRHEGKYWWHLWSPIEMPDHRKRVRKEIEDHIQKASFIIIPENLNYYFTILPYGISRYKQELADYINSPDSPELVVRMILHDNFLMRMLLVQRKDEAKGQGVPLVLPYGKAKVSDETEELRFGIDKTYWDRIRYEYPEYAELPTDKSSP